MRIEGYTLLEEDEQEVLCPVCRINILDDGEPVCAECVRAKTAKPDPVKKTSLIGQVEDDTVLSADGADLEESEEESLEEELDKAGFFVEVDDGEVDASALGIVPEDEEPEEEETEEEHYPDEDELDYVTLEELDSMEFDDDDDEDDDPEL